MDVYQKQKARNLQSTNPMITTKTPRALGYHMPAEWEPHEGTWISWPNPRLPYWGKRLAGVEAIFVQMVAALHGSEQVYLQVYGAAMEKQVRHKLSKSKVPLEHIIFIETKNLDVWTRDHGPIFVINDKGEVAITHWMFNGWGTYNDLAQDTSVPARIHEITGMPYFNAGLVLEGGSIEVNGQGTLITTKQCLLNANRNPYSKDLIAAALKDYLGIQNITWLDKGLFNDDTAGHIDNLVRFIAPERVLAVSEEDKRDENYKILRQNLQTLHRKDKKLEIVALPTPGRVIVDGERRAASYANLYIGNTVVLCPVFGTDKDNTALGIIREQFPTRRVVPINCRDLIVSGGSIHCVTQQQPKGRKHLS